MDSSDVHLRLVYGSLDPRESAASAPKRHLDELISACNYHTWSLRHIRRLIDRETVNTLACSIVATRLDYCNAVLYGVTDKNIRRLQRVQNSSARVVCAVHLFHYYSGSQLHNELSTRLQHSHSRHGSIINPPICTICSIITYGQPVHCDHLPPTCYRNQQQLPRHLTGHLPSLLLIYSVCLVKFSWLVFLLCLLTVSLFFLPLWWIKMNKAWNNLPTTVRSATSLHLFSRHLKT